MNKTFTTQALAGWGGYNPLECSVTQPSSSEKVSQILQCEAPPVIARGLGRSYGDSAIDELALVVKTHALDCVLAFNDSNGLLCAQAGLCLGALIDVILPRGWFLPTTPGTKFVTLGGAVAADVHGKNHHVDGTFGNWVRSLKLLLADGTEVTCSPEDNGELFWATIGGMGLTGFITEVEVQLQKVDSAYYNVDYRRCADLDTTLALLEQTEGSYTHSVGWIDCLGRNKSLGRSVLMLGNNAKAEDLHSAQRSSPFAIKSKSAKTVPCYFPNFALNRLTVTAFNKLYYAVNKNCTKVVDYDAYFYPLDSIQQWNKIYGRRGFVQYQALFPTQTARQGLTDVLETLGRYGLASFLAVIKKSGAANPSPLSYLFEGYTLALDIPNVGPRLIELVHELDRILLQQGGRLYLAKDSLTSAQTIRQMYPRMDEFLAVKKRVDPHNRFISAQARRLNLFNSNI